MMPKHIVTLRNVPLTIGTLVLLTACQPMAGDKIQNQTTPPPTAARWSISMVLTGGIAGSNKSITVDHTGRAVIEDKKVKQLNAKTLSVDEMQALQRLISQLPCAGSTLPPARPCYDCFNYILEYTLNGTMCRRELNDMQLAASDAQQLIVKLRQHLFGQH